MAGAPFVTVVVPHFQDLEGLKVCLSALERQTYPADRFEIIVADNNSPVGEAEVARAVAGRAKLVRVVEPGAGMARNGGVARATGELLAFTDSDCIPDPAWLAAGVAALADHDFVGGAMRVSVTDPSSPSPVEAFELVFAFHNKAYVRSKGFTVTANLICRRDMFEKTGGFRSQVSEDVEWCRRATAAGFRLGYAAGAIVTHPARRSWPELERKLVRLTSETYALMLEQPFGKLRWLLYALALPPSAIVHTPLALLSPALRTSDARWGALRTLYKSRLWRSRECFGLLGQSRSTSRQA
ncbi:MAG: glycosyltransferase [Phenylobacterium sp.]|uniref:glycosyltransferase n=1 Tax=Phenylobacterium sp. TaxID=1871053 RepID=UPI0025F847CD|nr:glycosyltransferase [Phenylobacterium sp.]MBI1198459.1 glycosyltransferase [Phenylobacterium sp.]